MLDDINKLIIILKIRSTRFRVVYTRYFGTEKKRNFSDIYYFLYFFEKLQNEDVKHVQRVFILM